MGIRHASDNSADALPLSRVAGMDSVPILHNKTTAFLMLALFVGAEIVFVTGVLKIWGYSRQGDQGILGQVAHGVTTVVG